jgi:excisionase family DNA binding protein
MAKEAYTTHEVGKICQVDYTTVSRWVEQGKLEAFQTPGGHRRIRKQELLQFLKKHKMPLPPELAREGRIHILVVDDDDAIQKLMGSVFRGTDWAYELETAVDGFEAGQKVLSFDPDVVILDVFLPGMNGFQVCQRIGQMKRAAPIKVLAISGEMTEEVREQILKAGALDVLPKPFSPKQMVEKLEALCPALKKNTVGAL